MACHITLASQIIKEKIDEIEQSFYRPVKRYSLIGSEPLLYEVP